MLEEKIKGGPKSLPPTLGLLDLLALDRKASKSN
jgi:hypothetical protein